LPFDVLKHSCSPDSDARTTSISKSHTLKEIAEFWATHSLGDFWDQTREVEFELRAERKRRFKAGSILPPDSLNPAE
jgi:hypothetical protein